MRYDCKKTHTLCRRWSQRFGQPISKIITRYYKSLANAAKAITFVDRAYIYDNSVDNQLPRLLYRTTDGNTFKRYTDDIPLWAQTIIG